VRFVEQLDTRRGRSSRICDARGSDHAIHVNRPRPEGDLGDLWVPSRPRSHCLAAGPSACIKELGNLQTGTTVTRREDCPHALPKLDECYAMSSQPDPAYLTDALLDALDQDEDVGMRARGDEAARPAYYLKELPVPDISSRARATVERAGRSAAYVTDVAATEAHASDESQEGIIRCPSCGTENNRSSKFCSNCGAQLQPAVRGDSSVSNMSGSHRVPASLRVTLISINEDGSDGPRIELRYNDSVIGRAGDVRFPTDAFLSPKHARFSIEGDQLFIEDLYSLNGTYVKLREETRLTPGDTFLMGRQVLRFEKFEHQIAPKARAADGTRYMGSPPPSGHFKLLQIGIGGITQNVYCLHESGAVIGREKGDIIFPRDKFMSGRHAQVYPRDDGHFYLMDLSSSNGTWVKIWERRQLAPNDFVFLGQQLFRVEVG